MVRRLRSAVRAYGADTSASVAAIGALMFPVLVGMAGLGAETGYWYLTQRKVQHEADVSAHAAATRKTAGDADNTLHNTALYVATESGYQPASGTLTVNPNYSPDQVEVVITQTFPRLLSALFTQTPVKVHARSVAGITGTTPACLIALSTTAPQAISVTGNGNIVLNNCAAVSNSTHSQAIYVHGSGTMNAECSYTATGSYYAQKTNGLVSSSESCSPEVGVDTATDPYANVPEPVPTYVPGTACFSSTNPVQAVANDSMSDGEGGTIDIYRFCGGIQFSGTMQLKSGLYIVRGNIDKTGQPNVSEVPGGTGVTFFVTSPASNPTSYGLVDLNGGTYTFKAPTKGPYSGLVFFGDRQSTGSNFLNGNATFNLTGAMYFPGGSLDYSGNNAASSCTQLIANTISFTGTGGTNFGANCAGTGTKSASAGAGKVVLVE